MKKILVFAVILALLVPAAAFAATEFTLGGFVKLDSFWDSTQTSKNMLTPIARDNDPTFHHGRTHFTAQGSRFNFTIKGPKVWGAQSTGFIEMDFDSEQELGGGSANAQSASNNYKPRLRHAMFRFNWPTTELLFGQYWSMFCEFYNESVQDGPLNGHGMPTARLPQVRVTQNLGSGFSVAGLIGEPNNITSLSGLTYPIAVGAAGQVSAVGNSGQASETPQVQAKIQYEQDLWGKSAYYGRPMPFTARIIGGWQRNAFRSGALAATTLALGNNAFGNVNAGSAIGNHQYMSPWMVMGNVFIPVIPTHSANLAGTASLSVQAYLGQGVGAFGENMTNDVYATLNNGQFGAFNYMQRLYQRFGGYAQAQYYFTNHWFANISYGFSKVYNIKKEEGVAISAANPTGSTWAGGDQAKMWQEVDFTLWYRPIQAIKFGLQYAWQRTDWLQVTSTGVNGANTSNTGNASRVEFVGFFYF
jgi:hypothetical protein